MIDKDQSPLVMIVIMRILMEVMTVMSAVSVLWMLGSQRGVMGTMIEGHLEILKG